MILIFTFLFSEILPDYGYFDITIKAFLMILYNFFEYNNESFLCSQYLRISLSCNLASGVQTICKATLLYFFQLQHLKAYSLIPFVQYFYQELL